MKSKPGYLIYSPRAVTSVNESHIPLLPKNDFRLLCQSDWLKQTLRPKLKDVDFIKPFKLSNSAVARVKCCKLRLFEILSSTVFPKKPSPFNKL